MAELRPVERLPEDLANKIAAGEVVERPASVVKELLENALDAGARGVRVEIEAGGRGLVRVRDDGHGMTRPDAEMALERHATSKLRVLGELQRLETHGFRGEALPSIASVSELVLVTRAESSPAGTEIAVSHGRRLHVRDAGHPRGTTVEVRDLFAEVPARRKFLRADATEAGHVAEAVTLLALARPETGFFLRSGGRPLVEAPAVDGLRARVFQLFGERFLDELAAVEGGLEWAAVRGYVSRPEASSRARPNLRLFVNRRPVRDRGLAKAVAEAYRSTGAGARGFEAVLFVELPPHLLDVNVHPAKTEVRFADPRTVWAAVERGVREALAQGSRRAPRADTARVERTLQGVLLRGATSREAEAERGPAGATRVAEAEAVYSPGARVLGQHRLTYIVASDGVDLLLVDQHTAHERVRFERVIGQLERRSVESQRLLVPALVELAPELWPVLEAYTEALRALGYDVEPFGGGSLRLAAVPALLGTRDPGPALASVLRDLSEREAADWAVAGDRDRLAATLACHSAVRAGQALGAESMEAIVRDVLGAAHPTLCPHGRPTLVRIPREDTSRWFGRTGWRRQ